MAERFLEFLTSRLFLIIMTIAVAFCTSSFAFDYGDQYDRRYAILFAIALCSLTFFYAKKLPKWLLSTMSAMACGGLILFTMFVSSAAWLSVGTSVADPEIAVVQSHIKSLESQITDRNLEIAGLLASGNPVNARKAGDHKAKLEKDLSKAQSRLAKLQSKNGRFESGAMAIFGYISKISGLSVEAVTLFVMWPMTFILICMEVTLGAAATSPSVEDESQIHVNRTETDENGTEDEKTETEKPKSRLRKTKGSTHKTRTKVRTAILNGEDINYETLKSKYGAGRSTISAVVKELADSGHLIKNGRKWQLKRAA